jgi:hypothetical protein
VLGTHASKFPQVNRSVPLVELKVKLLPCVSTDVLENIYLIVIIMPSQGQY